MNKKEWVKQFQETNGRLPEANEFLEAKNRGEFSDLVEGLAAENNEPVQEGPGPENQGQEDLQGLADETTVPPVSPVTAPAQPAPSQEKDSLLNKENLSKSVNQAITGIQNAIPDDVAAMSKGYWSWLTSAWKQPSNHVSVEKWYGYTTIGLIAFFSTLALLIIPLSNKWVGFKEFFVVFLVIIAYYMVYALSAFLAKRFVYGDKTFSFNTTVNHFGRLWALPAVLILAAFIFVFLGLNSLVVITISIASILIAASSNYMLFHQAANNKLDPFYRYVLATLIQVVLLFLFFLIVGDVIVSALYNAFYSEINDLTNILKYL